MKKITSLLILLAIFASCSQNISFNNPSVQGKKDGILWRATESHATRGAGTALSIEASNAFETLTLNTTLSSPGVFPLGTSESKKATFITVVDGVTSDYETGYNYTTNTGIGDGQIQITEHDTVNMTVSGTFRFNAKKMNSTPGEETLNFYEGVFYKVPVR